MGISNVISLLGGLGAFLFGMSYMGDGLQMAAGNKMRDLLEKLTRNPVLGFMVGMLVTVVIQSSSATTVMSMGFINAGIMDLAQATGVIFGANIGTTITSILIALDVSAIAPVCIALGALLLLYSKKKQHKAIGQTILGFGLLFQGLHTMSSSMKPLKDSVVFQNFILNAKNPLLGFLIGIVLCAIIQSSSAAVGILQALAMQGLMPLYFAGFIICGINVGSCTPVVISSLNAKNNAKRAALVYLLFNLVGAVIFMPLTILTPFTSMITARVPSATFQVSLYHILFKVISACVLLPLTKLVVALTYKILPKQAHESAFRFEYIDSNMVGNASVSILQINKEVDRVIGLARTNIVSACEALINNDISKAHDIRDNEEVIDYLTTEIISFITKVSSNSLSSQDSKRLSFAFQTMNELEQIGDHACKILEQAEKCKEAKMNFSESAKEEFRLIYEQDILFLDEAAHKFTDPEYISSVLLNVRNTEEAINHMTMEAQASHAERLNRGECTFEQGLPFVEALNSLSRIANHTTAICEVAQN